MHKLPIRSGLPGPGAGGGAGVKRPAARALLRPGGTAVITTRPTRQRGELVDYPSAVLAAGTAAGLIPADRCVALLAGMHGSRLIARPSFFQLDNTRKARARGKPWHLIAHEDVLVFREPFPASSRELKGPQREPEHPPQEWRVRGTCRALRGSAHAARSAA